MELFSGAVEFMKNITEKDDIVIIFNNDGDGICSCVLIQKYLERRGCKKPFIISQPMPPEGNLIRKIQTTLPTKIIFLDMAIDQEQGFMKKLGNICDMLIIDHHQVTTDMNGKNIVHMNPRLKNPKIYQSTTYLAYKIVSQLGDFSDSLWVASVGMISDYNLDDSQDVVNLIREKYGIKNEKMYESHLGRLADMISAAKATKMLSMEQLVELFMSIKDPYNFQDVRNADKLLAAYQEVENEIVKIKSEFESRVEKIGDVIFYRFASKYNLRSPASTMLSERYRNKIVVVYEKVNSWIDVSSRNQSKKYNMGMLLKRAAEGLKGSAGGHEAAAGAKVPEKNWEAFKQRLLELVNS
ncbi:MAG: DHH family phosphoesterase [Candidatus Aenigmarchaeota archaeon]|nr:DHH family phosphoesterase [Candidatus Aenigmarchaeota archaeon]